MIRAKNKEGYAKYTFVNNTKENREQLLQHGDKLAVMAHNGVYEVYYDKGRDTFKARMGSSSYYGTDIFYQFAKMVGAKTQSDIENDWGKKWARIANSMRTCGINIEISNLIEKMLVIGYGEIQILKDIRSSYDENNPFYPKNMEYKERIELENKLTSEWEAKHANILKGAKAYEILSLHTQNHTASRVPQIARINLPKQIIEIEIEQVKDGRKEKGYVGRNGTKRDLSFSIWKGQDGEIKASYASEYSGCGNGAYYIPFSPSYAFYAEHD